eukprot:2273716-Amphidinium_carterae.1
MQGTIESVRKICTAMAWKVFKAVLSNGEVIEHAVHKRLREDASSGYSVTVGLMSRLVLEICGLHGPWCTTPGVHPRKFFVQVGSDHLVCRHESDEPHTSTTQRSNLRSQRTRV